MEPLLTTVVMEEVLSVAWIYTNSFLWLELDHANGAFGTFFTVFFNIILKGDFFELFYELLSLGFELLGGLDKLFLTLSIIIWSNTIISMITVDLIVLIFIQTNSLQKLSHLFTTIRIFFAVTTFSNLLLLLPRGPKDHSVQPINRNTF